MSHAFGGIEALLIRLQLAEPNGTVLTAAQYNELFTMHGTTMVFLFGMPLAVAALGWWLHQPVFVAAGLVIAFEETLEISIVVWALRQEANGIEGYA